MAEPVGGRLPAALREVVSRANLQQTDIAERLGVDQGLVSRWMNGIRRPPLEAIAAIEEMAGVPLGTILRHAGYVEDGVDVISAVHADRKLSDAAKRALIAVYDGFHTDVAVKDIRGMKRPGRRRVAAS